MPHPQTPLPLSTTDATQALSRALLEGRPTRARQQLKLGADVTDACFVHEVPTRQGFERIGHLTAVALAVLCDCDALEDDRRLFKPGTVERHRPPERLHLLPLLAAYTDFSGVHGVGGRTLLHFAREPLVAEWLLRHGAPCDVPDAEGRLPGDTLPPRVCDLVNRHLLARRMPAATAPARTRERL